MNERVHVVWLCFFQDLHVHIPTAADAIAVKDLVRWIVVLILEGVKAIETAGCHENGSVRKCLSRCIPPLGSQLLAGLCLKVVVLAKPTDSIKAVSNGGINEFEWPVAADGHKSAIREE